MYCTATGRSAFAARPRGRGRFVGKANISAVTMSRRFVRRKQKLLTIGGIMSNVLKACRDVEPQDENA